MPSSFFCFIAVRALSTEIKTDKILDDDNDQDVEAFYGFMFLF